MNDNLLDRFYRAVYHAVDTPATWFKEKIVEPNQQKYPWYHQQFRRVPTVDQCYVGDSVCEFEATYQYKRDKLVDNEILNILRTRLENCVFYERPDTSKCDPLYHYYKKAEENWFIKHGDLGAYYNAPRAYMKQKHRMIWERRHGPVGTGMKSEDEWKSQ